MLHEPLDTEIHVLGATGIDRFLTEADGDCRAVVFVDNNPRLPNTKRSEEFVEEDGGFRCVDKGNKFCFTS